MPYSSIAHHLRITAGEALIAAAASLISVLLMQVPVWAMFVGWIAYFTRGISPRDGVVNLLCVWAGLAIGMAAYASNSALTPYFNGFAIAVVVFWVALLVLSFRAMPTLNNLLGFFLGLVCFFASHLPPSFTHFYTLGSATLLGSLAACAASLLHKRWSGAAEPKLDRRPILDHPTH